MKTLTTFTENNPSTECIDSVDDQVRYPFIAWANGDVSQSRSLQNALAEGVRNVGVLEQIADSCVRLFEFARRQNRISRAEMNKIAFDASRIHRGIWDNSPLLEVLAWYVVPLYSTIIESMVVAEQSLTQFGSVWTEEIHRIQSLLHQGKEVYVLADHSILREMMRNLFSNARHGFLNEMAGNYTKYVRCDVHDSTPLGLELSEGSDIDPPSYFEVHISTRGIAYQELANQSLGPRTIDRQRKEMEAFGSELEFARLHTDDYGYSGTLVKLTLISRMEVHKNLPNV